MAALREEHRTGPTEVRMRSGRIAAGLIVGLALLGGAAMYYLQVYAYYDRIDPGSPAAAIRLVPKAGGPPQPIRIADFAGIDATSSPIRYRACLEVQADPAALRDTYRLAEAPVPLTGPGWFDCYDAEAIGEALESGEATAYLSQPAIAEGVQRIVAVFPDGRAYAWHQLTEDYAD